MDIEQRRARALLREWIINDGPITVTREQEEAFIRRAERMLNTTTLKDQVIPTNVDAMVVRVETICRDRGWDVQNKLERGAYLHLEVSELIEAWRGKGKSTPAQEAADVLLVFLSILAGANVTGQKLWDAFEKLCADLVARRKGRDGRL